MLSLVTWPTSTVATSRLWRPGSAPPLTSSTWATLWYALDAEVLIVWTESMTSRSCLDLLDMGWHRTEAVKAARQQLVVDAVGAVGAQLVLEADSSTGGTNRAILLPDLVSCAATSSNRAHSPTPGLAGEQDRGARHAARR